MRSRSRSRRATILRRAGLPTLALTALSALLATVLVTRTAADRAATVRAALPAAAALPDIALQDTDGNAVVLAEAHDRARLVFLGYTHCPDVCPLVLAQLAELIRRLDDPAGVEVVMITLDPGRDTPQALRRYLDGFSPAFSGLRGDPAATRAVLEAFSALARAADPLILHTDAVALVGKDGRVRALYGQTREQPARRFDPEALAALEHDLRALLRGEG